MGGSGRWTDVPYGRLLCWALHGPAGVEDPVVHHNGKCRISYQGQGKIWCVDDWSGDVEWETRSGHSAAHADHRKRRPHRWKEAKKAC
jgi:hypothetical protein